MPDRIGVFPSSRKTVFENHRLPAGPDGLPAPRNRRIVVPSGATNSAVRSTTFRLVGPVSLTFSTTWT